MRSFVLPQYRKRPKKEVRTALSKKIFLWPLAIIIIKGMINDCFYNYFFFDIGLRAVQNMNKIIAKHIYVKIRC